MPMVSSREKGSHNKVVKAGKRAKSQTERNPPDFILFEICRAEKKSETL
jgi:hypothetical protein